jgi:hypothetical protein
MLENIESHRMFDLTFPELVVRLLDKTSPLSTARIMGQS